MKITEFRATQHRQVSAAVLDAIKEIGDQFGIDFRTNGGTIGAGGGSIKLEVNLRDATSGKSQAKMIWDMHCRRYGLEPDDFGRIFMSTHGSYRIVGIKPSAPKYPILADRIGDDRTFKFPASTVKFGLPKKAA